LGNVIYIITDKSVVVVDTTESQSAARATFDEFRKVSQLPVSYIIYTHHHGDHINGAKVFKGETTKIIAQKRFVQELANYRQLLPYNRRVNAVQFGVSLPPTERGVRLATNLSPKGTPGQQQLGYIPPDILFDEKYSFEEGGVRFELYHTMGETFDHLMVWMPQEQVLLPGDLFYMCRDRLSSRCQRR
jgi:glyoxylase-like metal-dependent hydrolase (beta-lactamase superfamily II)